MTAKANVTKGNVNAYIDAAIAKHAAEPFGSESCAEYYKWRLVCWLANDLKNRGLIKSVSSQHLINFAEILLTDECHIPLEKRAAEIVKAGLANTKEFQDYLNDPKAWRNKLHATLPPEILPSFDLYVEPEDYRDPKIKKILDAINMPYTVGYRLNINDGIVLKLEDEPLAGGSTCGVKRTLKIAFGGSDADFKNTFEHEMEHFGQNSDCDLLENHRHLLTPEQIVVASAFRLSNATYNISSYNNFPNINLLYYFQEPVEKGARKAGKDAKIPLLSPKFLMGSTSLALGIAFAALTCVSTIDYGNYEYTKYQSLGMGLCTALIIAVSLHTLRAGLNESYFWKDESLKTNLERYKVDIYDRYKQCKAYVAADHDRIAPEWQADNKLNLLRHLRRVMPTL